MLRPSKDAYGPGSIVRDPARPSDLYVGGSAAGLWTSTDSFERAAMPGDSWSPVDTPSELNIGPNSVAVTSDGQHEIAVAVMWDQGIWRYVED